MIGCCCGLVQSTWLEIFRGGLICKICLKQVLTKTCKLCSRCFVLHVSASYRIVFTLLLKSLISVFRRTLGLLYTDLRVAKAWQAFPILTLISSSFYQTVDNWSPTVILRVIIDTTGRVYCDEKNINLLYKQICKYKKMETTDAIFSRD